MISLNKCEHYNESNEYYTFMPSDLLMNYDSVYFIFIL